MNVSTYGEHAELAARALNALLQADNIPAEPEAVDQLLHCRESAGNALRQRLYDLGNQSSFPRQSICPRNDPRSN